MKLILPGFLVIVVLAIVMLQFCGRSSPRYYIHMVNRTPRELEGVGVYYNGIMAAECGHLVNGGEASFGPVTLPIPIEAEVRWDDRGVHHAPKVRLKAVVPEKAVKIRLYFIIEQDASVTFKWVRSDDVAGAIEATKGIEKFIDR